MLTLLTTDCEGLSVPTATLENYFLNEKNKNATTCNICRKASDQHQYCKEIVQLSDVLFLSYAANRFVTSSIDHAKVTELFIRNHLDMSAFASSQL
ncbi:unnamed protein product, partial [Rotaria sp. Silwood1]